MFSVVGYLNAFGVDISPDLELALLGFSDPILAVAHPQQFAMVEVKRVILTDWKSTLQPSFHKLRAETSQLLSLNKATCNRTPVFLSHFV